MQTNTAISDFSPGKLGGCDIHTHRMQAGFKEGGLHPINKITNITDRERVGRQRSTRCFLKKLLSVCNHCITPKLEVV